MDAAPNRVQAPYMLDNLTADAQRISASLPPDGWDSSSALVGLKRDVSGVSVVVSSTSPRRITLYQLLTKGSVKPSIAAPGDVNNAGHARAGLFAWLRRLIRTACRRFRKRHKNAKGS